MNQITPTYLIVELTVPLTDLATLNRIQQIILLNVGIRRKAMPALSSTTGQPRNQEYLKRNKSPPWEASGEAAPPLSCEDLM